MLGGLRSAPLRSCSCSRLSRETRVQTAPPAATGTQAPPPPPLVGEFGSCCSSPCCSGCCPGWWRREAAALVPSRFLHFCGCSAASFSLGTPFSSVSGLTPGTASCPAREPPPETQAHTIPSRRPSGLAAWCAWGLSAFGEAAPPARTHPHTAPSLYAGDSPDASSPWCSVHSSAAPRYTPQALPPTPFLPLLC